MAALPGPTFLGIGAQKAGTTWLHKLLSLHPDIGMPQQKELHFWDRETPDAAAIAAYRSRFADLRGKARGEITPSYAILPPERIQLIHQNFPELNLIYVLRNPMERAWSQARMELARELHRGVAIPETTWGPWLASHLDSPESRTRGDYASCLRNWLQHYSRESLLIGIHEENLAAPREFLISCAHHLGVDTRTYSDLPISSFNETVSPEREILGIKPLDLPARPPKEQMASLLETYTPVIQATEAILGRSLSELWLRPYS